MRAICSSIVFLVISLISCTQGHIEHHLDEDQDWDILMFTQHWPITVCQEWKHTSEKHTCAFPIPEQLWTVHGLWPTKFGSMGPQYCNRSWHFDVEQIRTIEPALNQLWINVEKETSTYSLWAHEWTKHGTCAAVLPTLASEFNYFSQGLYWQKQYSMNTILAAGDVFPHATKEYSVEDFYKAVKNQLGVEPIIECREENGSSFIFEIRICFDKKLQLSECTESKFADNSYKNGNKINTNCPTNKGILYPSSMESVKRSSSNNFLVELYRLIAWLQWFTL